MNIVLYLSFLVTGIMSVQAPAISNPAPIALLFLVIMLYPLILDLHQQPNKKALLAIPLIGIFGLLFELFAIQTGWPYGEFQYSELLGGKIKDLVPWTVFLAWPPIIILSALYANQRSRASIMGKFLIALALVIAFDAVLDPAAVAIDFWSWENHGAYYGIPLSNYLGWLISGSVGLILAFWLLSNITLSKRSLLSATMILGFWTGICIATGLIIPALIAVFLMLIFYLAV